VPGVGSAAWQHKSHPFFVWQTLRQILGIEGKQREPWSWGGHLVVGCWGAGIMAASLIYTLDLVQTHVAAQASSLHIFYFGCKSLSLSSLPICYIYFEDCMYRHKLLYRQNCLKFLLTGDLFLLCSEIFHKILFG
jgi:hypothetical protein